MQEPAKPCQRTQQESAIVDSWRARRRDKAIVPRIRISAGKSGGVSVSLDHPDVPTACILLEQAIGVTDLDFLATLIDLDETKLKAMLSVVTSDEPPTRAAPCPGRNFANQERGDAAVDRRHSGSDPRS